MRDFSEELLHNIAQECQEYESVANALFGLSMTNVTGDEPPRCDYCVHWLGSTCHIFRSELYTMD
ncbi:MAG: hypothetical protein SCK28_01035 [Bacillota bacterium]|nr:hypothetical protein [Bacillota bacterium]